MIKEILRKLLSKPEPKQNTPFKINIVDQPPVDSMAFNMLLGFDVSAGNGEMNIHINNVGFMSNGPKSALFIQESTEAAIKAAVATLCMAAGKHMLNPNTVDFKRSQVNLGPALGASDPKTDINLN